MEREELNIIAPDGYEIDKNNSTFECIKFCKKRNHITIEHVWESINNVTYPFDGCASYRQVMKNGTAPKIKSHELSLNSNNKRFSKAVAYTVLSDIAEYYNKGWEPDWKNSKEEKYRIAYYSSKETYVIKQNFDYNNGTIIFKNEEDAQAVIDNPNFQEILDTLYQ